MYTIYLATCAPNGKGYVGQTKGYLCKRRSAHIRRKDYDCFFHRALRKYGSDAFDWQQISKVETKAEADNLERAWIILLRTRDRQYGYNITAGGAGSIGVKFSYERRLAHSAALKAAHAKGKFEYRGGVRKHTEATKLLMSVSRRRGIAERAAILLASQA